QASKGTTPAAPRAAKGPHPSRSGWVNSRRPSRDLTMKSRSATAQRIAFYIDTRQYRCVSNQRTQEKTAAAGRLSTLDRWLPVWIGLAMVAGLALGRLIPGFADLLTRIEISGISVPIALGLLVMMYPVLAKVRFDKVAAVTGD